MGSAIGKYNTLQNTRYSSEILRKDERDISMSHRNSGQIDRPEAEIRYQVKKYTFYGGI